MPLDYEEKYREAYRRNVRDIHDALKKGELDTKIRNFCERHGFESEKVKKAIARNPIVAAIFAKDPKKQNFCEKIAAEYIAAIKGVKEFKNLAPNEKQIIGGAVTPLERGGGRSTAKTIDFEWLYSGIKFYASHKYTKDSGGSQDNTYKELQTFISEARLVATPGTVFIAIADGNFYQMEDSNAKMTRIERLEDLAGSRKVFACTIDELEKLMKKIVKQAKPRKARATPKKSRK